MNNKFKYYLIVIVLISIWSINSFAYSEVEKVDENIDLDEKLFIVHLSLGKNWDATKPANEQKYFSEHSKNLSDLRSKKVLLIGARYSDKGMMIFKGETKEEIRKMFSSDRMIEEELFNIDIQEFSPFYKGCIE